MIEVNGTTISMTRGDTFRTTVSGLKPDGSGEYYEFKDGDVVKFTVKKSYGSDEILIEKYLNPKTMVLEILPEDTKNMRMPSSYVYDVQLTKEDGTVDTFICEAKLEIRPEVG